MPFRHHDEKTVTASPLESAVTNRDARNPFTIRFLAPREVEGYEHRQMASPSPFNFASLLTLPRKKRVCKSLVLNSLRTLPSSVSRKAFICHPYENCRVYTNNSHSRTRHSPLLTPHNTQVFCFQAIPNSLHKTPGGGVPLLKLSRCHSLWNRPGPDMLPFQPLNLDCQLLADRPSGVTMPGGGH